VGNGITWKSERLDDGLIALFSLGLAVLFLLGKAVFWLIYVILFVRAVGGIFHLLAMQASTPLIVPEKHLGRLAGANQTLQGAMSIAALALGGQLPGIMPIEGRQLDQASMPFAGQATSNVTDV